MKQHEASIFEVGQPQATREWEIFKTKQVPKYYLEAMTQQIKRVARLVEEADEKAAVAAEVGDDVILQLIDAKEADETELERTTVPEEAILEPYSKVEDAYMSRKMCLLI